uniref:Uncharacterized protein n=1 Tax=Arundo donax TaxID=35708 RepID=A0A0A9EEJ0_ARUDO
MPSWYSCSISSSNTAKVNGKSYHFNFQYKENMFDLISLIDA